MVPKPSEFHAFNYFINKHTIDSLYIFSKYKVRVVNFYYRFHASHCQHHPASKLELRPSPADPPRGMSALGSLELKNVLYKMYVYMSICSTKQLRKFIQSISIYIFIPLL